MWSTRYSHATAAFFVGYARVIAAVGGVTATGEPPGAEALALWHACRAPAAGAACNACAKCCTDFLPGGPPCEMCPSRYTHGAAPTWTAFSFPRIAFHFHDRLRG